MQWDRIINLCANSVILQMLCEPISMFGHTNHVLMKDVPTVSSNEGWLNCKSQTSLIQSPCISRRLFRSKSGPVFEVGKFDQQHRRLQFIKSTVDTYF